MTITDSLQTSTWNAFLLAQAWSPFLQSFEMGSVYEDIGQEPIRLALQEGNETVGVCFAHVVEARRGKHLSIPYGPVLKDGIDRKRAIGTLMEELKRHAKERGCAFIRISPFIGVEEGEAMRTLIGAKSAPLHVLAEHLWLLPLDRTEDAILMSMRKTTRNLIRRAEKEGVTIERSEEPRRDIEHFLRLHDETRRRHHFTPYTNAFFRAQVQRFSSPADAESPSCMLYLARYDGSVIAASIHMHCGRETSYHHGASDSMHAKIPASYLLQWRAIQDAKKRGDRVYNFWGIAPQTASSDGSSTHQSSHPFAGVTLFKTGFGGEIKNLAHAMDLPLSSRYYVTRGIEFIRKWRRGF